MVPEWHDANNQVVRHRYRKQWISAHWPAFRTIRRFVGMLRLRYGATIRHTLVFLMLIVSLLTPGWIAWSVAAQEATPPAEAAPPIAGATIEILDSGQPMDVPDKVLNFVRITLEPGGYFHAHGHPGAQIWYVETGAFNTTVMEGTMRLTRVSDGEDPALTEEIGPGIEITVSVGESVFFDRDVLHTVQNTTDEPTVFLIAAILEAGEPEVIFVEHGDGDQTDHEGTPAS